MNMIRTLLVRIIDINTLSQSLLTFLDDTFATILQKTFSIEFVH